MSAARTHRSALLRRTPSQLRGKRRVEAILDAAEQVFGELGFEGATTEAIAERAGASIGSLYQFFPNKKALFAALSERYLERARALFEGALADGRDQLPWTDLVDELVDGFHAFHEASPAFRAIWVHGDLSPELVRAGERLNRTFAGRVEGLVAREAPALTAAERAAIATVVVEATSALLWCAGRAGGADGRRLVEETKRMLRAYLGSRLA